VNQCIRIRIWPSRAIGIEQKILKKRVVVAHGSHVQELDKHVNEVTYKLYKMTRLKTLNLLDQVLMLLLFLSTLMIKLVVIWKGRLTWKDKFYLSVFSLLVMIMVIECQRVATMECFIMIREISAILVNVVAMISKVIVNNKDVLWSGREIKMWWREKLSWSMFVEVLVVKREKRTMVRSCDWERGEDEKDVARFSLSLFCIFSPLFLSLS
jgi:hypothetical protein